MSTPNAMLGFNTSLDGDNQWMVNGPAYRMALARGMVYDQIFKQQDGEKYGIRSYLQEKSDLYRLGRCNDELTRTRRGDGLTRSCDRGAVFWYPAYGVRAVQAGILAKWNALGGETGSLGLPVTDPLRTQPRHEGDWHQFFENGVIYLNASAGAPLNFMRPVDRDPEPTNPVASIRRKVEALGLSAATTEPQVSPDGTTWWQRFGQGYVYWTAGGGAKYFSEPMRDAWTAVADELGPPTTEALQFTQEVKRHKPLLSISS
jgi:uncharacterized protein with LGFP repeats